MSRPLPGLYKTLASTRFGVMAEQQPVSTGPSRDNRIVIAILVAAAAVIITMIVLNSKNAARDQCPDIQRDARQAVLAEDVSELVELNNRFDSIGCPGDLLGV